MAPKRQATAALSSRAGATAKKAKVAASQPVRPKQATPAQAKVSAAPTMSAVRAAVSAQMQDLAFAIQEYSVVGLAGLTTLEHDLKQIAKDDYHSASSHLEDADKLLDFVEAEWACNVKEVEQGCSSCLLAFKTSSTVLDKVQELQGRAAQQLTKLISQNKVV